MEKLQNYNIYHTNIAYMLVNKITKSIDQASKELNVSWANIHDMVLCKRDTTINE